MRKEADIGIRDRLIILFSKLETSITLLTKVKKKKPSRRWEAAFEKYRMQD